MAEFYKKRKKVCYMCSGKTIDYKDVDVLKKYVVENKCNLGIAYDGDGDRCLAVDEYGEEIDGDKLIAIISNYLKEKGKLANNTIVATVMSNLGLKKYAEKDQRIRVYRNKENSHKEGAVYEYEDYYAAISLVRGEYFATLDSDDIYEVVAFFCQKIAFRYE